MGTEVRSRVSSLQASRHVTICADDNGRKQKEFFIAVTFFPYTNHTQMTKYCLWVTSEGATSVAFRTGAVGR